MRSVPQPVKVVLGGIVGLALGYLIVYWISGQDMLGLLPRRDRASVSQQAAVVTRRDDIAQSEEPAAPATKISDQAPDNTVQSEAIPQANDQAAESDEVPPSTPPAGLSGAPAAGTDQASPSTAADTTPTPTPIAEEGKKHPQPTIEECQKMLAELRSIYKSEFDKSLSKKKEDRDQSASFFRVEARKLATEPIAQFVLLNEALHQALILHNFIEAAQVIDDMEGIFEVDAYRLRILLLTEAAKAYKSKTADEKAQLIAFATDLAEYAQAADRGEDLETLAGTMRDLAFAISDRELKSHTDAAVQKKFRDLKVQVSGRAKELETAAKDRIAVLSAREQLAADPQSAAANLIDGKHRCFVAGDWETGLKLLAQSDQGALAAAAKQDLAGPSDGVTPGAIAALWFDLGESAVGIKGAYARAGRWYKEALKTAQGVEKVRIEKRLEAISAMNLPLRLTDRRAATSLASARFLLTRAMPDIPDLMTPIAGALLDNARTDGSDARHWEFVWSQVAGATQYEIELISGAGKRQVHRVTGTKWNSPTSVVLDEYINGWSWHVRAYRGGQALPWSQTRTFNVEPPNSDPPQKPVATSQASDIPTLISPRAGAVLDNGRMDRMDTKDWEFQWSSVKGATHYELEIMNPNAPPGRPPERHENLRQPKWSTSTTDVAYIAPANLKGWRWRVRAYRDGQPLPWSEARGFDVEPPNVDPPRALPRK